MKDKKPRNYSKTSKKGFFCSPQPINYIRTKTLITQRKKTEFQAGRIEFCLIKKLFIFRKELFKIQNKNQ